MGSARTISLGRAKTVPASTTLTLAMLMLVVAAAATVATAQTYTNLYNFDGIHGTRPESLAQGRDGNLYGTTELGGTKRQGVVFKIAPSGDLTVLFNFGGVHGAESGSGLTLGTDGNFYGTTLYGGAKRDGTIFKITRSGNLTILHRFTGGTDGDQPHARPIQGVDGNFYGTAAGTAYKITSSGTFTALGTVPGDSWAPLLQGTDENFYGTTQYGGSSGLGTVFRMTPKGSVTIVHSFDGTHGENLYGPLIQARDGNFYGTTSAGGSNGGGVAFKLTPHGDITVLHNFGDPNYPNDGFAPYAGFVQATDGNFYSVTGRGGTANYGVIFQITLNDTYSILYNFDGAHWAFPNSTPMQHTDGKIYGVAFWGGTHGKGVVYSLDVGLGPFVSLLPTAGHVGKPVGILGKEFTGATGVSFNGTPATFTVVSDTYLKTRVPSGASSGFVTVTTPGGTLKSNQQFRVKR